MQLRLFQLKLKANQILHRRDHFVFTLKFLNSVIIVITVNQIAR